MKKDDLRKLAENNNGYLFTAEVIAHGISKTYLAKFVKENEYELSLIHISMERWLCGDAKAGNRFRQSIT